MQNSTERDLRAREVVSERTAKHVAAVFQAHDLHMVADKHWLWSVDEAQLAEGESFDLLTAVAIHSQKRGDARRALWSAMGAESERHMRRNDVDPGLQDTALSFVMENMPDYEEFDKTGYIWGTRALPFVGHHRKGADADPYQQRAGTGEELQEGILASDWHLAVVDIPRVRVALLAAAQRP